MKILRKLLKIISYSLLAIILLFGLAIGALQTSFGASQIENIINNSQTDIKVSGLKSGLPFNIKAAQIITSDPTGKWLEINNANIKWGFSLSPFTWEVSKIEIAKIKMLRLPEEVEDKEPLSFELPELPRVAVDKVNVPLIEIAEKVTGNSQTLEAKGSVSTFKDSELNIKTLKGTLLAGHFAIKGKDLNISIREDAGGLVGNIIGIEKTESLSADLKANGLFPNYKGTANINTSARELLDASFASSGNKTELNLLADAKVTWPDSVLYDLYRKVTAKSFAIKMDVSIKNDGSYTANVLDFTSGNLNANLKGSYKNEIADFTYKLNLADLTALASSAGNITLEGIAKGQPNSMQISGKATGAYDKYHDLVLDYKASNNDTKWNIEDLKVSTSSIAANISGNVDTESEEIDLKINSDATESHGIWNINGALKGKFDAAEFKLAGSGSKLRNLPPALMNLASGKLVFETNGLAKGSKNIEISTLKLNGQYFDASGKAIIDLEKQALDSEFKANIKDASKLNPALKGQLAANGNIKGGFDTPAGKIDAKLNNKGQTLSVKTSFALNKNTLSLPDFEANTKGLSLTGNANYNLDNSLADGKINLNAKDLTGLEPFINQKISGSGQLTASLKPANKKQQVEAKGNFSNLAYGTTKLANLGLDFKSSDMQQLDGINAKLSASGLQSGKTVIDKINFTANGNKKNIIWNLSAVAKQPQPINLSAGGNLAANLPDWNLALRTLKGNYAKNSFALQTPANIKQKAETITVDNLALLVNGALLNASGIYSPTKVDAKIILAKLNLGSFTDGEFSGNASANVNISGNPAKPLVKASGKVEGLKSPDAKDISLNITSSAVLENNILNTQINGTESSGGFNASITLPAQFSLNPFNFNLPQNGKLSGSADVNANLATLTPLFLPPDQNLAGKVNGKFTIGGTLENPALAGNMLLNNGKYENISTGTLLENIEANITSDGNQLKLANFNAKARSGNITASGGFKLAAPYPISLEAVLSEANLMQSQEVDGVVNGKLTITGNAKAPEIGGNLVLGPMEINLPEKKDVNITVVNISNPDAMPRQKWQKEKPGKSSEPSRIKLALKVEAPSRVFVRGQGLETEMRGSLFVGGTTNTPQIEGELHTVRGTFQLLDRNLELTEGILTFQGPMPPSPILRITAETKTNDITAGVKIDGPVSEPKITLTSDPVLPQDEIMAQILFGRELKSITPMQGIRLVQALNSLRGGGGGGIGFDPLGQARKVLNVDKIDFDTDDAGNVTVGAGKYITDKVYLGVESGAGEDSGKVKTSIEATKNITVEAESGANSNGVRINWKHDY